MAYFYATGMSATHSGSDVLVMVIGAIVLALGATVIISLVDRLSSTPRATKPAVSTYAKAA